MIKIRDNLDSLGIINDQSTTNLVIREKKIINRILPEIVAKNILNKKNVLLISSLYSYVDAYGMVLEKCDPKTEEGEFSIITLNSKNKINIDEVLKSSRIPDLVIFDSVENILSGVDVSWGDSITLINSIRSHYQLSVIGCSLQPIIDSKMDTVIKFSENDDLEIEILNSCKGTFNNFRW